MERLFVTADGRTFRREQDDVPAVMLWRRQLPGEETPPLILEDQRDLLPSIDMGDRVVFERKYARAKGAPVAFYAEQGTPSRVLNGACGCLFDINGWPLH